MKMLTWYILIFCILIHCLDTVMQNSDKASTSISVAGSGQLVKMHETLDFCLI